MSQGDVFQSWLSARNIEDVEAFVPDMAGAARGKVVPAGKFGTGTVKMPESIFQQTVSGDYVDNPDNVEDRDMVLVPDPSTLRPVPWTTDPTASVFLDCYAKSGEAVATSPRGVLQNVLAKFEARGWVPVVAPEVEFYLLKAHSDPNEEAEPPQGRLGWTELARQPFSIDTMNDFDPFISDVYVFCEAQGIHIDTLSQEMGRRSSRSISCTVTPWIWPTRCSCSNVRCVRRRSATRCTQPFWQSRWPKMPAVRYTYTRVSSTNRVTTYSRPQTASPATRFTVLSPGYRLICRKRC